MRKHLHIDGAGWHDAREPAPYLGIVQQAVWERRKIRIRYPSGEGGDGAVSVVQPWGLIAKRHTWYFAAVKEYCEPVEKPAAEHELTEQAEVENAAAEHSIAKNDSAEHIAAKHVTAERVAAEYVNAEHATAEYATAEYGVSKHTTAEHSTADHATAEHAATASELGDDASGHATPGPATPKLPEPRTYRISRLAAVELLEERFVVPNAFDLAQWWERSVARFRRELPVYPVRLYVREEAWARFSREIYVRVKTSADAADGWVDTEADFHTPDSALAILLGYGASIRVAEPLALARSVASEAKALLALYEGPDSAPQDQGHI